MYRIFVIALIAASGVVSVKYVLHKLGWETIEVSSLHSSLISGVIFVLGFLMSATIADYKEAERIPAEVASAMENMALDAVSIHANYPEFDYVTYQKSLEALRASFASDARDSKSNKARKVLAELADLNAGMETAGVPANFIVKIKQQQALITRHLFRVHYIQRISVDAIGKRACMGHRYTRGYGLALY